MGGWNDKELGRQFEKKSAEHADEMAKRIAAERRVAELEAALHHIIGTAGHPNAAEGCRLIINRAKQALGDKL